MDVSAQLDNRRILSCRKGKTMYGMPMFYTLQLADGLTTLIFLTLGISEGNPLVRFAMSHTNPIAGLLIAKAICIAAGIACSMSGRMEAVKKLNFIFAVIVAWNLTNIVLRTLA